MNLEAGRHILITAGENSTEEKQNTHSTSGNMGVSLGVEGIQGIRGGYSSGKGKEEETSRTYEDSRIKYDADKAYGGLQFLSKRAFGIDFAQYLQKYFNFQVDRYNDLESRYQAQGRQFSVEIYNLIKNDTNQVMD